MKNIDPSDLQNVPLAECDRCKRTYAHRSLRKDVNFPSLLVCQDCKDDRNPLIVVSKTKFNLDDEIRVRNPRPMAPLIPVEDE